MYDRCRPERGRTRSDGFCLRHIITHGRSAQYGGFATGTLVDGHGSQLGMVSEGISGRIVILAAVLMVTFATFVGQVLPCLSIDMEGKAYVLSTASNRNGCVPQIGNAPICILK